MNLNPLSAEEFNELALFLASEQTPGDCLDLEGLEGLFVAAICSPVLISPLEAIQMAFGGDVFWESDTQADAIYHFLLRLWNNLAQGLESGDFELHTAEVGVPPEELGMAWANGFVMGMDFHFDAWQPLIENEEFSITILPITVLSGIFDEESGNKEPIVGAEREKLLELLVPSVITIYDFWSNARENAAVAASAARRDPGYGKIGRNEPCPCGSNKKFKQCCGKSGK